MRLLMDTHILIWTLLNDKKLPSKARSLIEDPHHGIYFSMASVWEIAVKHAAHPDEIPYSARTFYEICQKSGFIPLEGKVEHVLAMEALRRPDGAPKHKDPFDRLLIGQAKFEQMVFLTHDALLSYYNEPCVMLV